MCVNWVCFAFLVAWAQIRNAYVAPGVLGRNVMRWFFGHWFVAPPVFGVVLSANTDEHYTTLRAKNQAFIGRNGDFL